MNPLIIMKTKSSGNTTIRAANVRNRGLLPVERVANYGGNIDYLFRGQNDEVFKYKA